LLSIRPGWIRSTSRPRIFHRGYKVKAKVEPLKQPKPFVRETPHYPSLDTGGLDTCTKPIHGKVYTGTKMLGIGTLHKSNAVPIFTVRRSPRPGNDAEIVAKKQHYPKSA